MRTKLALLAIVTLVAAPVFAQTTTTVQTTQPAATPPPPPPPPTTQVVVQPSDAQPAPATTTVRTRNTVSDDAVGVETTHHGRPPVAIVATDALWGGLAGTLVGGGVALINQGGNWSRDLMIGAGAGILAGTAFGLVDAFVLSDTTTTTRVSHAAADAPAQAPRQGYSLNVMNGRF